MKKIAAFFSVPKYLFSFLCKDYTICELMFPALISDLHFSPPTQFEEGKNMNQECRAKPVSLNGKTPMARVG